MFFFWPGHSPSALHRCLTTPIAFSCTITAMLSAPSSQIPLSLILWTIATSANAFGTTGDRLADCATCFNTPSTPCFNLTSVSGEKKCEDARTGARERGLEIRAVEVFSKRFVSMNASHFNKHHSPRRARFPNESLMADPPRLTQCTPVCSSVCAFGDCLITCTVRHIVPGTRSIFFPLKLETRARRI